MENGAWNCFRCGNHGNWSTLIRIFNIYGGQQNDYFAFNDNYNDLYNHYNATKNIDGFECVSENEESEIEEISRNDWISEKEIKYQNDLLFQEKPLLNRLIKERNLSSKCFKDYKCGLQYKHFTNFHHKQQCITFPMYQFKNNKFIATKYKTRCVSNGIKQFSQYPVMNESGLFGFDDEVSNNKSSPCVITEGEYDSMAIYYGTDYKVKPVSLPNGANNISNKLIKQLNQVHDNFILFLDWDEVGQRNANLLRDKMIQNNINGNNVQIVGKQDNPHLEDVKDANDIMIKHRKDGHDVMNELLKQYL